MSLKKALISTVAAAAVTTSAFAVSVSNNGLGNYLVLPAYNAHSAYGNWSTDLRVVNTNETHCTIAKVVVRESKNSTELIDFPIYLSPGDVWVGKLYQDTDGKVKIYSADESMIVAGALPSATNPVNQALFKQDTNDATTGYVEVYQVAKTAATNINATWTINQPLSKLEMYNKFTKQARATADVWRTGAWALQADVNLVGAQDLYATQVVSADGTGAERGMTLMATAFNLDATEIQTNGAEAALNSKVDDGSSADTTGSLVSQESIFQNMYEENILTGSDDQIARNIEDALAKTNVYTTFWTNAAGETQLIMNQPVKHYHVKSTSAIHTADPYYDVTNRANYCFYYETLVRDNHENTTKPVDPDAKDFSGYTVATVVATRHAACNEVTRIDALADNVEGYTDGYTRLTTFDRGTAGTVQAQPFIPVQMTGVKVGAKSVTNVFYPAYK